MTEQQEFELEMIKFTLIRVNPEMSFEEIEKLATQELKEIYQKD